MHRRIILVAFLLIQAYAKAASCSANATGNWETAGTWSCGHVPAAGDNVTIGAGFTITVNANNAANIGNLNISGILMFTGGSKISLSASSIVNIFTGGSITGGNGGAKLVFPSSSYSGPFSTNGPFYFTNTGSGTGLLPLILVTFYSEAHQQEMTLFWSTEHEENIESFEVESGGSGSEGWQSLAIISPMAASGGGYTYQFTDRRKINGERYYRLKIADKDGKYIFSKILSVASRQTATMSVAPTLVYSSMNVTLPTPGRSQVSVYNISGQPVKNLIVERDLFNLDVSGLTSGAYFLRVVQGGNSYITKFIKH